MRVCVCVCVCVCVLLPLCVCCLRDTSLFLHEIDAIVRRISVNFLSLQVLAISDDPLGREAVRLEDQPGSTSVGEIYAGPVVGGYVAVMFNRGAVVANMSLHLADIVPHTYAADSYTVRDL